MNHIEHIESALTYIEANLKFDTSLADMARAAGYSEYHFLRVFKEITHLTPADYVRKRRLSESAREIASSGRPIAEIAFEYGFNSKENFTRAFKAEHHVLPTQYRAAGNSLKLYERMVLEVAPFSVEPRIVRLDDFALMAVLGDEAYAPNCWNKYNCSKLSKRLSGGKSCADYGLWRWCGEANRRVYHIGIRAEDAQGDTSGAVQIDMQGGLCAVFSTPPASHFSFVNTIHRTWHFVFNGWMPQSGYRCAASRYQFETYVEDSRLYSEDIYIPIE